MFTTEEERQGSLRAAERPWAACGGRRVQPDAPVCGNGERPPAPTPSSARRGEAHDTEEANEKTTPPHHARHTKAARPSQRQTLLPSAEVEGMEREDKSGERNRTHS